VNLQPTPFDNNAIRINGMIDDVIQRLMKKLDMEIPFFLLRRRIGILKVPETDKDETRTAIRVRGLDSDGSNYSFLTKVKLTLPSSDKPIKLTKEPFQISNIKDDIKSGKVNVKMHFQKHHDEPNLAISILWEELSVKEKVLLLEYDPYEKTWIHCYDLDKTTINDKPSSEFGSGNVTENKNISIDSSKHNVLNGRGDTLKTEKKENNTCAIF